MTPRSSLAVVAAIAAALGSAQSTSAATSGVTVASVAPPATMWAISDEDPAGYLTTSATAGVYNNFRTGMAAAGRPLKSARLIVPYNTMSLPSPRWRDQLDALVAHSASFPGGLFVVLDCNAETQCPAEVSVADYTSGFNALHRAYGAHVAYWGAWNEPDHKINSTNLDWQRAAQYWVAAKRACPSCQIVAGEFASGRGAYIRRYISALRRTMAAQGLTVKPRIWSFHPYREVVTSSGRETRFLLSRLRQWDSPQIWYSEAGVCLHCGGLRLNASDQAAAANHLIALAARFHIARVYYYSLTGSPPFDSGLQGRTGLRPAFCVLAGNAAGPCTDSSPF